MGIPEIVITPQELVDQFQLAVYMSSIIEIIPNYIGQILYFYDPVIEEISWIGYVCLSIGTLNMGSQLLCAIFRLLTGLFDKENKI